MDSIIHRYEEGEREKVDRYIEMTAVKRCDFQCGTASKFEMSTRARLFALRLH